MLGNKEMMNIHILCDCKNWMCNWSKLISNIKGILKLLTFIFYTTSEYSLNLNMPYVFILTDFIGRMQNMLSFH